MDDNIKDLIDDDDLAQTLVMRNAQLRVLYGERAKWVKERRELRQALEESLTALNGVMHIIDEHGTPVQKAHATRLLHGRKVADSLDKLLKGTGE